MDALDGKPERIYRRTHGGQESTRASDLQSEGFDATQPAFDLSFRLSLASPARFDDLSITHAPRRRSMTSTEKLNTHQKALQINLDPTSYGSFAEIGAGQEVVRWFLVVGGASGTVAKSISAYDKEVSDDLYGPGSRYVSRERLVAMVESEWAQLLNQLAKTRGSRTRFFCFVDTISARNFAGTNESHGWIGLRFQVQPGGEPNDLLLHINMRDPSNVLQQEAIGILAVNLIYAALYQVQSKESFLENIAQDVEKRIEID